jgi:hypothetical protein
LAPDCRAQRFPLVDRHHILHSSRLRLFALVWLVFPALLQAQVPLPTGIAIFDDTVLTQAVTVSVQEINKISISGSVSLTISTATAGSAPDASLDSSSSYNLTVNGTGKKLTGVLDGAFASGITLQALLTAPTGGTATQRTLSITSQDLVTGIGHAAESSLSISYTASASASATPNGAGESRTVTFTLTTE